MSQVEETQVARRPHREYLPHNIVFWLDLIILAIIELALGGYRQDYPLIAVMLDDHTLKHLYDLIKGPGDPEDFDMISACGWMEKALDKLFRMTGVCVITGSVGILYTSIRMHKLNPPCIRHSRSPNMKFTTRLKEAVRYQRRRSQSWYWILWVMIVSRAPKPHTSNEYTHLRLWVVLRRISYQQLILPPTSRSFSSTFVLSTEM